MKKKKFECPFNNCKNNVDGFCGLIHMPRIIHGGLNNDGNLSFICLDMALMSEK